MKKQITKKSQNEELSRKWVISVIAVFVIGILLMMNFYGARSVEFDLTSAGESDFDGLFEYTPHLTFPKGEYSVNISGSGTVTAVTGDGRELASGRAGSAFTMTLEKDESDIIILGGSSTGLRSVEVSSSGKLYSDLSLMTLLLILGMLYALYIRFFRHGGDKGDIAAAVILCVAVFASYPLFSGTMGFGHDLNFHLYRIEGIKDGLLSGQFPVRVHPTHNNGYGYITASVYPELFLYIPALLRLLGASPVYAYNTFLFLVNVATAVIMYISAKGISKSVYTGVFASVVYTLSTWRVINLCYRAALGEALSMVFFPLVIYGLFCLLKGDKKKWWILALGCTGVFQSHIISTVFVMITIAAAVIMFIKSFVSERRWLGFFKAAGLTVLLNMWYLPAFINYYFGLDMAIRHTKENTEFFANAVFPTELFNVFNTEFGYSQLMSAGLRGNMSLSLGVGVSVCLVLCAVYFLFRKKRGIENEGFAAGMFAFGMLLLFMATTLFPWEILQQNKLINMFCGTVRMPWRFLSLASPIFCIVGALAAGAFLKGERMKKAALTAAVFVCAVSFVHWGTAYTTELDPALKKGQAVSTDGAAGLDDEYYVVGTDAEQLTPNRYVTGSGDAEVLEYKKDGSNIEVRLSGASEGEWLEVPLLYYDGYSAEDNNGNRLELTDGDNHCMRVALTDGAETVNIRYSGHWYFKLGCALTLLTVLAAAALKLFRVSNNRSA